MTIPAMTHADGTISGWVHVEGHVYPIHPIAIQVIDPVTGAAVTGLNTVNREDGTYEITGVPEGNYKVFYDAFDDVENYIDELTGDAKCDNGDCDRVELGSVVHVDSGTTTLNINLAAGAMISGKVTDQAGKPLPGVSVEFYDQYGKPYCCERLSDENGNWERPVYIFRSYFALARYSGPSSYQPLAYPDYPCSGCEISTTGTPIEVEFGRHGINFKLAHVDPNPDIERETVDVQKFSGSWFDPNRDGEGFIVEVLDEPGLDGEGQAVVVFWFTYTPDGNQSWMVGVGEINSGVAEVEFEITDGASFGADFDPQQVDRKSWGSLRLDFLNCNHAQAEYGGDYGSGQLALTRLSAIHGLGCADTDAVEVASKAFTSGAWFNPARDGEGFVIEAIDESRVLAYWFTYDTDGRQMWMLGVGELDDGLLTRITMQRTFGGHFGDAFDPASLVLENWGDVTLQFGGCNDASYAWEAPTPYFSGGFPLVRLTVLKNISC